ncbi:hypothetical protein ABBQ38_010590 [Trebouxia sp. C0009 RCD-2024]
MTSASAESVLQEAATDEAWPIINAYFFSNRQEEQWTGVRLLHIKLQQSQTSAADFAGLPECRDLITELVQLLNSVPALDPISLFPLDVSASISIHVGHPPMHLIRQVMRAQMTGLVLGVLVQLALANIPSLADDIYMARGLQLLHGIALAHTPHAHPELSEAASHAATNTQRQICQQVKDRLCNLQDCCHPLAGGTWQLADGPLQAPAVESIQSIVSKMKSAEPVSGQSELQQAWWSAVGGYNERQAGNCLFWLFEEPQTNNDSSSSVDTGSVASGYVQGHGEQSEEYAGATEAGTESRTNSTHVARPSSSWGQAQRMDYYDGCCSKFCCGHRCWQLSVQKQWRLSRQEESKCSDACTPCEVLSS